MARKIEPKPGDKYNMLTYVGDEGREPSAVMCGKQLYTRLGRWKCDCGKEIVCRNRYVVNGLKKSCGCLLRAKGEAWHRGKRRREEAKVEAKPKPKTFRFLVTIQVLDTEPGAMIQYAPESPNRAEKET
jgi:hypothetical protein